MGVSYLAARNEARPAPPRDPRGPGRRGGRVGGGRARRKKDEPTTKPVASTPKNAMRVTLRLLAGEGEAAAAADRRLQRQRTRRGGRCSSRAQTSRRATPSRGSPRARFKPVAWSPAVVAVGAAAQLRGRQAATSPDENPSIVRTPLVIAMWEPMARALGWPKKPLGFADILELSRPRAGLGGRTASRSSAPSSSSTRTPTSRPRACRRSSPSTTPRPGKKEGLTEKDVANPKARKQVRDIERSIVHYGDTTLFIADQLRKEGPGYATAVAMEEVTLLDFNRDARGSADKLVAIYPEGGDVLLRQPVHRARCAVGVGGAEGGRRRLPEVPGRARSRPSWRRSTASAPSDRDESPGRRRSPSPTAPTRSSRRACSACPSRGCWRRSRTPGADDRKPANILLVLDTSGSMNDEQRLERAKAGLRRRSSRTSSRRTAVGLTIFSDKIQPLVQPAPLSKSGNELRSRGARPDRRRRHRVLRRDDGGVRLGARAEGDTRPHQRGRAAHRRRGHRLADSRSTT